MRKLVYRLGPCISRSAYIMVVGGFRMVLCGYEQPDLYSSISETFKGKPAGAQRPVSLTPP
jgi:hypothetical protein